MTRLIPLVALAAVIATPAFARTRAIDARNAVAYQAADAVDLYGKVVGQDPDPNVRLLLRRTAGAGHD